MRNLLPIQDLSEKPEGKAKNSLRYHCDASSCFWGKQATAKL